MENQAPDVPELRFDISFEWGMAAGSRLDRSGDGEWAGSESDFMKTGRENRTDVPEKPRSSKWGVEKSEAVVPFESQFVSQVPSRSKIEGDHEKTACNARGPAKNELRKACGQGFAPIDEVIDTGRRGTVTRVRCTER